MTPPSVFRLSGPRMRVAVLILLTNTGILAWMAWGPMEPLFQAPRSTVLLDRNGILLGAGVATDGQWRFPPVTRVPERFATCLIQFEDRHFHDHWGVYPPSIVRALKQNLGEGRVVSGGSTITMQVARLSMGNRPRTLWQKLIEVVVALRIELRYDKQEILALFASNAPFGGNVVGLDAAAWRYFSRPADQLSWAEAATLAVLPNAPSVIFPGRGPRELRRKRDRLLDRLLEIGELDSIAWSLALQEPLPAGTRPLPRRAPHLLATMRSGGHEGEAIRSTIDGHLQDRATAILSHHAPTLVANEVHNAALLVLDVRSGEVLAYVGNLSGTGAEHAGDVDIVRARRSSGSILKPFLYAAMLQDGERTPDMLVADVPTRYEGFAPRNYDGQYLGAVPASEALARSLNVPAVRALREHGVERTLKLLRDMGLASIDRSAADYGLSLMVGGAECSLWEVTGAYASMGRILLGTGSAPTGAAIHAPVLVQVDHPMTDAPAALHPVGLKASAVHFTFRALREVQRPEGEGDWRRFAGGEEIAWKTGTSFGHRDAWAIGITDRYCVGVWTGNADGEGRPGLTGSLAAAPVLFELFGMLPDGAGFDPPFDDLVKASLCKRSGHRAGMDCAETDSAWVPLEALRTPVCPYHQRILVDAAGRHRVAVGDPGGRGLSCFVLPPAMELYTARRDPTYRGMPPWADGAAVAGGDVPMEMIYPQAGGRMMIPTELDGTRGQVVMEAAHRDAAMAVHWDLDGSFLGTTTGDHRMPASPGQGRHRLTLTDSGGRVLALSFDVTAGDRSP